MLCCWFVLFCWCSGVCIFLVWLFSVCALLAVAGLLLCLSFFSLFVCGVGVGCVFCGCCAACAWFCVYFVFCVCFVLLFVCLE